MNAFIRFIALALCSCLFQACGGGTSASASDPAYPPTRLVGEVFAISSEISASDFRTNAGYSGNPSTSRALQASGRKNILDMLFMLHPAALQGFIARMSNKCTMALNQGTQAEATFEQA